MPSGSARTYQFWSPWPDVDLSRAKGEQPIELRLYGCGDCIGDYEGITGHDKYRNDLRLLFFASLDPHR